MESKDIYEESYQELTKIQRSLSFDTVEIIFKKLDTNTRQELITAIQNVISKRKSEIDSVRLGVQ